MARYYFNVLRNNQTFEDDEGTDHLTTHSAWEEATQACGEMMRRLESKLVLLLAMALLIALSGHAQAPDAYAKGLSNFRAGDYAQAAESFQKADATAPGTTDALVGAFTRRALPLKDMSWFAQTLVQLPLNTREDFKPGRRLSIDTGLRYEASERLGLLLQANALFRGRDSGAQAEPEDSGGRSLWVSPGVSYALTKNIQAYGFVQLPLYQYVNGVQLVATRSFVFGFSTRF